MSIELALLNAVAARRDLSLLVRSGLAEDSAWHEHPEAYRYISDHVAKFGETPSVDSIIRESVVKRWPKEFEAVDVSESPETLCTKLHERNVKLDERRILEDAAKRYATSDAYELQRFLETELDKLRQRVNARTGVGAANWTKNVEQRLTEYEKRASGEFGTAIPLCWPEIDDAVGGFHRGDYVDIEGRTKSGKSFVSDVVGLTANRAGYRVLAEKAESTKVEAMSRLDTLEFGLSNRALYSGTLDDDAVETYKRKLDELSKSGRPDYVIKTPEDWPSGLTIAQIEADIDQYRPDVVIIDQFNLMRHSGGSDHQAKAETSRQLKLLFARKGVVGVVLTQANGDYVKRIDRENDDDDEIRELRPPRLGDYSETIAVRQDCTHMIALDSVQWPDVSGKMRGKAMVVVEISRTGGAGTAVDLEWLPNDGVIRPRAPMDVF